jgi:DnaD/phage-associated family protein
VPDPFFNLLLEEIEDLAELKVTLRLIWLLGQKPGPTRYVSEQELIADATLARSLVNVGGAPVEQIKHGLALAITRGTLLRHSPGEATGERYYLLNSEENRRRLVNRGTGFRPDHSALDNLAGPSAQRSRVGTTEVNIFGLYENNIGTFGPMIAQQLAEAEERYPPNWIEEAFKTAVNENKRSWNYIAAILRRWAAEGRGHRTEEIDEAPSEIPGVGVKGGATLWEDDGRQHGEPGRHSEEDDRPTRQPRSRQRR